GAVDYTTVFVAQQFVVQQQNLYSQAQADIALGMIGVYRALGGGWEIRLPADDSAPNTTEPTPEVAREIPVADPAPSTDGPHPQKQPAKPAETPAQPVIKSASSATTKENKPVRSLARDLSPINLKITPAPIKELEREVQSVSFVQ